MTQKTILVVDDSAVMRQINCAVLASGGYRVLTAVDGVSALVHVRESVFDLILTDWNMVPMDGCELTQQVRGLPGCQTIPIVVLSTVNNDSSKSQARQAGANGWLCKPVEPETLLSVVNSLTALED
jgi:two-component system chemotaxis response regulator CheY